MKNKKKNNNNNNNNFVYALEERIGNPELFVGRQEELDYFSQWLSKLKTKSAKSTAILSRRKKGKTALVERLFNIIYNMDTNIIPFYFEIEEKNTWIVSFAYDFYCAFLSQYLGFKLKRIDLIREKQSLEEIEDIAKKAKLTKVLNDIKKFNNFYKNKRAVENIWGVVQSAPHRIALASNEFVVQIIDEFQFFNKHIYRDENCKNLINNLAGSYLSLSESKIAPLIVTGSWIGWLKTIIYQQLPVRFNEIDFGNLTEEEGLEATLNYSVMENVDISNDVAYYLNEIAQSDPFYISALIKSQFKEKDLLTVEGLMKTIEYEVRKGDIYKTWREYFLKLFDEVNKHNAKKIVLFLSKNREQEWTRKQIIEKCQLSYNDNEAENVFEQLCKGDLISEGSANNYYRGMSDNIFYKVFRYKYESEIKDFPIKSVEDAEKNELKQTIKKLDKKLKSLKGLINYNKGYALEYILTKYLKFSYYKKNNLKLSDVVENYQPPAEFTDYVQVKNEIINLEGGRYHQIDIFAESKINSQNLYIEVKNTEKKVSENEVKKFIDASKDIRKKLKTKTGFFLFYSINGFNDEAKKLLVKNKIMFSSYDKWKIDS